MKGENGVCNALMWRDLKCAIYESTVTIKGQTTLPRDVRQALGLHSGDRVLHMILDGGEVRILRSRPPLCRSDDRAGREGGRPFRDGASWGCIRPLT